MDMQFLVLRRVVPTMTKKTYFSTAKHETELHDKYLGLSFKLNPAWFSILYGPRTAIASATDR